METIGRYRLLRKQGVGAFATVWLGHDDELDVPVAVKVLADNWSSNADVRNRFVEEARALRRIADPRVVRVHDIGQLPDGRSYFVMDFADGGTLADLVRDGVGAAEALQLGAATARAVQVLHDHGILHRDVKPSNLLRHRTSQGTQLMIADLGMAKELAEASGLTMTAGTPAYMAPEQVGQGDLDRRADVYGAAGVAYALLTGGPPFPAIRDLTDVVGRDPEAQPKPVPVTGHLGREIDEVLRHALAVDRTLRPDTAAALAEELDRLRARLHEPDQSDVDTVIGGPPALSLTGAIADSPPPPGPRLGLWAAGSFLLSAFLIWLLLGLLA